MFTIMGEIKIPERLGDYFDLNYLSYNCSTSSMAPILTSGDGPYFSRTSDVTLLIVLCTATVMATAKSNNFQSLH